MLRFPDDREKLKTSRMTPMETPRPVMPKKDPSVTEKIGDYALTKSTNNLVDTTIPKIKDFFTPQVTPIAQAGTGMSPQMASAVIGSGADKAALVAKQAGAPMSIALKGGAPAMVEAGLATGGTGLGSMATAAMASPLAPIVGGLALAKMFGFFSDGGHVGPLYAADGNLKNVNEAVQKNIDRLKFRGLSKALNKKSDSYVRGNQEREGYSESDFEYPQNDRRKMGKMINELNLYGGGMAGPLSKVEYKSADGDVYKLSYGGGPLTKGE